MISQSDINQYTTELKKLSKKKLISIVINLTADMSNLQIKYEKLKKEKKNEAIDNNPDNKAGKRIITTD